MNRKTSKRGGAKRSKVGDLQVPTGRAGATRGGIITNWVQADGSVRPGEEKGVIAIIQPATVGR